MTGKHVSRLHPGAPERRPPRRWPLALAALCAFWPAALAAAPSRATFVSIDQDDAETRQADERLRQILERRLHQPLSAAACDYGRAINLLSEWGEQSGEARYLARVTPYVYIAAEMLGADFEIAGTYVSRATGGTTYHSYFVVNRDQLESVLRLGDKRPDLYDLLNFIRAKAKSGSPARFVYHSKFSTSSYFLPALFFRGNGIFAMRASTSGLTAIHSEELAGNSSSRLVEAVADGEADLAAVWDGTKVKFQAGGDPQRQERGAKVVFIQLPTALPNDLLVRSRSLLTRGDAAATAGTAAPSLFAGADGGTGRFEIDVPDSDFRAWVDIDEASEARDALAGLRWLASEGRAPMTVRIERKDDRIPATYVEAARQAVRLSGTEVVLHDDRFHRAEDYVWTLAWIRAGHITLTSEIPAFDVEQVFRISFQPAAPGAEEQDLTQRIGNLLTARLHRMRHIWPYDDERPLVIRDVPFSLGPGTAVRVQKIRWNDPLHNDFTGLSDPRPVEVEGADFFKFRLTKEKFRLAMGDGAGIAPLDPMSPVAYRVLLMRPQEPQAMFTLLNAVFFALVGLSGTGSVLAFRRARRGHGAGPAGSP